MVFFGKIVGFGELVLSEIALLSDCEGIVRQLRFGVEVPLHHCALAQADSTILRVQDISEDGYVLSILSIEKGVAEKKADGTVIVHDQNGKVAATLQKSFLVSDGSVNHVDYDVNGDTIVVKYSSPLVKGKRLQ